MVTCSDHRFAIGAWITIWSAFKYTPESKNMRFHLLTTDPNAPEFDKMMELAKRWGMKLSIKHATADSIKHLPASERLPIYAYLRLLAPGLLEGIGRFLYLDSDLLVRTSVSPLFGVLGENTIAAAARDYYHDRARGTKADLFRIERGERSSLFQFRSDGVDADAWRSRQVSERAMEYLDRHAHQSCMETRMH